MNLEYLNELIPEFEGLEQQSMTEFLEQRWINDEQEGMFIKNYKKNKHRIKRTTASNDGKRRACIIVGASSAVKKQIHLLKNLDDNFILVVCNNIYGYLLEHDIVADYVFLLEGRDHVIDDIKIKHNDTKLIVSPFVDSKILDSWGDNYETYLLGGGPKFTEMIREDFGDIDIGGGNVTNTSILWAYKYLMCRNFILCGVGLSFKDDYYADGRSTKHVLQDFDGEVGLYNAVDMYGEVVYSTRPLLMYKTWLETHSKMLGIDLINSSEEGILGVYPEPIDRDENGINFRVKYLPWINIAPLHVAIEAFTEKFNDIGGKNVTKH
jgi:hypothetical protein